MRTYEVRFRVNESQLPTVLQVLSPEVVLLGVDQTPESTKPAVKQSRYVNGKRSKGISSTQLILQELSVGPCMFSQLVATFVTHGFAEASCGPAINQLVRDGKVVRLEAHRFALAQPQPLARVS